MTVAAFHRTLEQELFALLRGASLECPVCGEFVMHEGPTVHCRECGFRLHGRVAGTGAEVGLRAG